MSNRSILHPLLLTTLATLPGCLGEPDDVDETRAAATTATTALCYAGPTAATRVPIRDDATLRGKLASKLAPGAHLELAAGTYQGDYTYDQDGRAGAAIVIEAAPGAKVTFTGTFHLAGSYGVLARVHFAASGRIELTGHHDRIAYSTFSGQDVGSQGIITTNGNAIAFDRIDHDEFTSFAGAAFRSDGFHGVDDNQGMRIDHDLFRDHRVSRGSDNESVVLMLSDAYGRGDLSYDSNLFDNVLQGPRHQAELVTIKTGFTTFRNNTITRSPNVSVSLRETNHTVIAGNFLDRGAGIRVLGDDNVIRGNRLVDGEIQVMAGDGTMEDQPAACHADHPTFPAPGCKGIHPAARHTTIEDNIGAIRVGAFQQDGHPFKALDTTLRDNDRGAVVDLRFATAPLETRAHAPANQARALQDHDVGVLSDDPSCP